MRPGGQACFRWRRLPGGGLSWVLVPLMYRLQAAAKSDPDFAMRFLMIHCSIHAGIGAAIGVTAGLALGWGLGDRLSLGRALIGGLLGALAGVFLFETINSMAFPMMRSETPLPEVSLARLAMYLGVAGSAAFLAGLAADARPSPIAFHLPRKLKLTFPMDALPPDSNVLASRRAKTCSHRGPRS